MSKPEELRRPSGGGTAPAPTSSLASTRDSQPPTAQPPPPGGAVHKGPPPDTVLLKMTKSLTPHHSPSVLSLSSSSAAFPNGSRYVSRDAAPPAPTTALVPAQCWYANPFTLSTNTPMSEFHRSMRGKVFFSPRAVPVTASEILSLPSGRPPQLTVCEIGKDLLYGVGYLYNTPLSVEHQWRGRVVHLLRVRSRQAPIPNVVRRCAEAVAAAQKKHQQQQHEVVNKERKTREMAETPAASSPDGPPHSPTPQGSSSPMPIDYLRTMVYERGEVSVYDRPGDDFLLGIKLYIDDELVEDHYPIVNALPQCTATLAVKEATQHWNCVPFVLMGYLNQLMLDPICVYHSLSLNFVEHLLRIKIPVDGAPAKTSTTTVKVSAARDPRSVTKKNSHTFIDLALRVEVVYGCRAEAFYCTEFISRGTCTLRMTESSKRALKSYEENLRALVRLRRAAPQLIARTNNGNSPPLPPPQRNCSGCGHPLQWRCTICGADVCGMPMCATNTVVGYPRACMKHELQSIQQS